MQIHSDDMITSCRLQHVCHEFRCYRCPRFVLFVLACVGEVGDYGGYAPCGCGFAGVDYDEELHEAVVDVAGGGGLEYEDYKGGAISVVDTDEEAQGKNSRFVETLGRQLRTRYGVPSSSRTDSPIVTEVSWLEYCNTIILVSSIPSLERQLAFCQRATAALPHLSATSFASSGWLLPVSSLIEFVAMIGKLQNFQGCMVEVVRRNVEVLDFVGHDGRIPHQHMLAVVSAQRTLFMRHASQH